MAEPVSEPRPRVLVVDDDPLFLRAIARRLSQAGYEVHSLESATAALEHIESDVPDVVVSDLNMPGANGIDLLRAMKGRDLDLPVIFLTGVPTIGTAARAVELGAFRYLTKSVEDNELERAIDEAVRARALARGHVRIEGRAQLERSFRHALETFWMAYQPLVSTATRTTMGYEALLRSREPSLPSPLAVIEAAEKLGALHLLGQRLRARVAEVIPVAPPAALFFVNLHIADLVDPDLFDAEAPLSKHAKRVVLELTERASIEGVADLQERIGKLRSMGYRIAIDDLGAGYAGLSYFASARPEVIKIDMSLVRGVDSDPVKENVIRSLTSLAAQLGGIEIVAEGVETPGERDMLVAIGCTYLQGYALARPGEPFPEPKWS